MIANSSYNINLNNINKNIFNINGHRGSEFWVSPIRHVRRVLNGKLLSIYRRRDS